MQTRRFWRQPLFLSQSSKLLTNKRFLTVSPQTPPLHHPQVPKQAWKAIALLAAGTSIGTGLYLHQNNQNKVPVLEPMDIEFIAAINFYIKKYYGDVRFPKEIFLQLSHLQSSMIKTPESNVRLAEKSDAALHIEVKRALSRWHCYALLLDGRYASYEKFIACQPAAEKLSFETFKKLATILEIQSNDAKAALEISCFIAMSDKAKILATNAKIKFSMDSEKFLSDTIAQCPQIFPAISLLNPRAKKLMASIFLPDTHGRHMLYTEGGKNMFTVISTKIAEGSFSKEDYGVWFGRWIANIAGFRGHEQPKGSAYLTEDTGAAVLLLNDELSCLWNNPQYDVLNHYLVKRGAQLGVKEKYLAHVGAMMRLYKTEDGKILQQWFDNLPETIQRKRVDAYEKFSCGYFATPTYEPAVMDNLLALGCGMQEALEISAQISEQAMAAYFHQIEKHKLNGKTTPLSYRDIAFKNNLIKFVNDFRRNSEIAEIIVDEQGLAKEDCHHSVLGFSSSPR
jgi:hypothetical protein